MTSRQTMASSTSANGVGDVVSAALSSATAASRAIAFGDDSTLILRGALAVR